MKFSAEGEMYRSEMKLPFGNRGKHVYVKAFDGQHYQRFDYLARVLFRETDRQAKGVPAGSTWTTYELAYKWLGAANPHAFDGWRSIRSPVFWKEIRSFHVGQVEEVAHKGIVCDALKFRRDNGVTVTVFFASEYGGLPVHYEYYSADKDEVTGITDVTDVAKVDSPDTGESLFVPTRVYRNGLGYNDNTTHRIVPGSLVLNAENPSEVDYTVPIADATELFYPDAKM